jgi:thiol:disulfide interchange protein DsbD
MASLGGGFAGRAETQGGHAGSFWTGALATVVATPCTAPFMGPALGFALAQPPLLAMSVFTALGAGMASPYIALAYFPRGLRWLPKPGAWMERFRQLMAFPLFATVLWLVSVFERQTDVSAMMRLLAGLLVVAFALWLWGGGQYAARRSIASAGLAILLAAIGFGLGVSAARDAVTSAKVETTAMQDGFWQPWSPSRVTELRANGHAVFVNFTAAWCLTCKVNEGAIFARADVRDVFSRHGVVALEADWTNADPDITRALAGFGRDGVPLYVFYPAGSEGAPVLLPQVPTKQTLETAFGGRG